MDLGLGEKTVLVTGASGGIGGAIAQAFAAEGACVAVHANSRVKELEAWLALQPFRNRALVVGADVRSPDEVQAAVDRIVETWGRLDVCVANAGIWPPGDANLDVIDPERVRYAVEVNLLGSTWTARAFMRALARTGPRDDEHGAALVLIGSTAGRFGERGHVGYSAAKAGLHGLVRTLKNEIVEIDPRARVNMVEPGWVVTDMTRDTLEDDAHVARAARTMALRQFATPHDIAAAVVTLASPIASRHVSGQVITVAGGMEGRMLWTDDQVSADDIRRRTRQR